MYRPEWRPSFAMPTQWTADQLRKYSPGRTFTLYTHGTCVLWLGPGELPAEQSNERLQSVTRSFPDFRVQRHRDGNFLVDFKGGVGGLMSGELLMQNLSTLRQEALELGRLPSESFDVDRRDENDEIDLIVGLYVRARLYQDVEGLEVAAIVR